MSGYLGLGSNVGDRRAMLEAALAALERSGVRVLGVVVCLRHGSGRRDPRPARLPQRLRAGRDRARARGAARRLQGGRARARPRAGRAPPRAAPDRRRPAAARRASSYRSERLTLPHEQVAARRFVLVPLRRARPRADAARRRFASPTASPSCRSTRACASPARRCGDNAARAPRGRRRQHPDALRGLERRASSSSIGASRPCASRQPTSSARRCATCSSCAASDSPTSTPRSSPRPCRSSCPSGSRWGERYLGHDPAVVGPGAARPGCRSGSTTRTSSAPTGSSTRSPPTHSSAGPASRSTSARR